MLSTDLRKMSGDFRYWSIGERISLPSLSRLASRAGRLGCSLLTWVAAGMVGQFDLRDFFYSLCFDISYCTLSLYVFRVGMLGILRSSLPDNVFLFCKIIYHDGSLYCVNVVKFTSCWVLCVCVCGCILHYIGLLHYNMYFA